jgi:hypothetical protein
MKYNTQSFGSRRCLSRRAQPELLQRAATKYFAKYEAAYFAAALAELLQNMRLHIFSQSCYLSRSARAATKYAASSSAGNYDTTKYMYASACQQLVKHVSS